MPLQLGEYLIRRKIGEGLGGGIVYLGEHPKSSARVAIKWSMPSFELHAWKHIQEQVPGCPGLPQLYDSGKDRGQLYAVTEFLGSDSFSLFSCFDKCTLLQRWRALRVIGRMLLRRLKTIHGCGYIHCDISPYNILLGRARDGTVETIPYLIDFGLARPCPGGGRLGAEHGTTETVSVRTAAGGERVRQDDIEALGWTLLWLLFGDLPWRETAEPQEAGATMTHRRQKKLRRLVYLESVRAAKFQLLSSGWGSLGGCWRHLADIPPELDGFMHACHWDEAVPSELPDYTLLGGLLGGRAGLSDDEAEAEDLMECRAHLWPLL